MKKLITAVLVFAGLYCVFASALKAEDIDTYWKLGKIEFVIPIKSVSAVSLYDIWHGAGYMGAETPFFRYGDLTVSGGGITSDLYAGSPFGSLQYNFARIIPNIPIVFANMGIWYGYDFYKNYQMFGLKASTTFTLW